VEVLGLLDDALTPTGFLVTPVVARLRHPVAYRPNPAEVAEVFTVPVALLRDPARRAALGARARALAKAYDWKNIIPKMEEIYVKRET